MMCCLAMVCTNQLNLVPVKGGILKHCSPCMILNQNNLDFWNLKKCLLIDDFEIGVMHVHQLWNTTHSHVGIHKNSLHWCGQITSFMRHHGVHHILSHCCCSKASWHEKDLQKEPPPCRRNCESHGQWKHGEDNVQNESEARPHEQRHQFECWSFIACTICTFFLKTNLFLTGLLLTLFALQRATCIWFFLSACAGHCYWAVSVGMSCCDRFFSLFFFLQSCVTHTNFTKSTTNMVQHTQISLWMLLKSWWFPFVVVLEQKMRQKTQQDSRQRQQASRTWHAVCVQWKTEQEDAHLYLQGLDMHASKQLGQEVRSSIMIVVWLWCVHGWGMSDKKNTHHFVVFVLCSATDVVYGNICM